MNKQIFTLVATFFCLNVFAQTTYYWVGGSAASFTANSSWNTALNGSGTTRTAAANDDVLIFDGSNIGGSTPATGAVSVTGTSTTLGQLKLQNNMALNIVRPTGGGGTGTITIGGGVGDDITISENSSLTLNSPIADGSIVIVLSTGVTGSIAGTITISNTGQHRITSQTVGGLVFTSTGVANTNGTPTTSVNAFGSSSQSVAFGTLFQSGATLNHGGTYSPLGNSSTFQAVGFEPGSNLNIRVSNGASTGSYVNGKTLANVAIQNGANFLADGTINKIENLTIDAGCTYTTHTSGHTPLVGNLTVNGTLTSPIGSTNTLVMGGNIANGLQTVAGTGTVTIASFAVGDNADVTMNRSIAAANSVNIVGKLSMNSSSQFTGAGTFTSRVAGSATSVTGNLVAGSYQITGVVGTLSGNTALTVSGNGIPSGTTVVAFSSSGASISLSKPIAISGSGISLNFTSAAATLATSNINGFDGTNGSVITAGTMSFQSGTNYIFNAATTTPFNAASTSAAGNITVNAPITTNRSISVSGTVTINTGAVTIRSTDTLRVTSTNAIAGTINNTQHIITATSGANTGVLRYDVISAATVFPIGNGTHYLPATITPTGASDICVGVFNGVTADATPTGTAFSSTQKERIVDAVWVINRPTGTGDCALALTWTNAVEGTTFAGFTNSQIGMARHDGTAWTNAIATSANAATNTVTATFSNLGAFSVGENGVLLPATIQNFKAVLNNNVAAISWQVINEINVANYVVERSANGTQFATLKTIQANNSMAYTTVDNLPIQGINYYRLKVVDNNGTFAYSNTISVNTNTATVLSIYPNPAQQFIRIDGVNNNTTISIYNNVGVKMIDRKAVNNIQLINIHKLAAGTYNVVISNGVTTTTKTFIKQ
jgi:Secretion system C-terminal sorting domain